MKPEIVDLPYPDIDDIKEDKLTARIISPAYAQQKSEMTAVLQYSYQYIVLEKQGYKDFADTIEEISIAEMLHLEILGKMLIKLGVNPIYTAYPPARFNYYNTSYVTYSTCVEKILLDDIRAEQNAIRDYKNMLTKLNNDKVSAVISRIILDEELHLAKFKEMYNVLTNKQKQDK